MSAGGRGPGPLAPGRAGPLRLDWPHRHLDGGPAPQRRSHSAVPVAGFLGRARPDPAFPPARQRGLSQERGV